MENTQEVEFVDSPVRCLQSLFWRAGNSTIICESCDPAAYRQTITRDNVTLRFCPNAAQQLITVFL